MTQNVLLAIFYMLQENDNCSLLFSITISFIMGIFQVNLGSSASPHLLLPVILEEMLWRYVATLFTEALPVIGWNGVQMDCQCIWFCSPSMHHKIEKMAGSDGGS